MARESHLAQSLPPQGKELRMIHKRRQSRIPRSLPESSPEEKESILKCLSAVEKKYEKGDAVFPRRDGDPCSMGFVLSGSVEISRDDFWGNRQVLGHAGSGELFGEAYACMPGEASDGERGGGGERAGSCS